MEAEDNDDLDGVPLDGLALLKAAAAAKAQSFSDDIDGVPCMVSWDFSLLRLITKPCLHRHLHNLFYFTSF